MNEQEIREIFNQQTLERLFPKERSNEFFEALFGDASEGAYDIRLSLDRVGAGEIVFHLNLEQRPGCCLVCSLTHGLPNVFSRHPIINIAGLVQEIDTLLGDRADCGEWQLQTTIGTSNSLHIIPLHISLKNAA